MKYCSNCGAAMEDDSRFCPECGAGVEITPPPVVPPAPQRTQQSSLHPTPQPAPQPAPQSAPQPVLYPAPKPKKKKKGLIIGLILGLVALLIGAAAVCWAMGLFDGSQDTDGDPGPSEGSGLQTKLEEYAFDGLHFYLSDDFQQTAQNSYTDGDLWVTVDSGPVSERDPSISSARELAQWHAGQAEDYLENIADGRANGVPYLRAQADGIDQMDEIYFVMGFYVEDGYCWVITVITENEPEDWDALISYATLGEVHEDEIPSTAEPTSPTLPEPSIAVTIPTEATEPSPVVTPITLTVWAPAEDMAGDNWLANRLAAFEAEHPEWSITWEIDTCSPSDVTSLVAGDPAAAADVYMFASDLMGTLIESGALAKLGGSIADQIRYDNSQTVVDTVTYTDGGLYGFPISGNTWYMFYNKDIFTERDVKSLDAMLAKGKVAFPMDTAWYGGAFFLSNGCTLFGEFGRDASAGIDFGGQKGYDAAKAMVELAANPNFVNDRNEIGISMLMNGEVGAAFTGAWRNEVLYDALGDDLGVAQLPMVTIGGQQVQLRAFAGSKAWGVNRYSGNVKASVQLAAFLASEESQLLRYEMTGAIPVCYRLADSPALRDNELVMAEINTMNHCAVAQPSIAAMNGYWGPVGTFGSNIVTGGITLDTYKDEVDQLCEALNSTGL